MESKPKQNEWQIAVGRKVRCSLCKRNLRLPCPSCAGHDLLEPCWVMFDRKAGNCHQHCCFGWTDEQY